MTEEERRPLMIHPNPRWAASNRRQTESSGEYSQITTHPSGRHINNDFDYSVSSGAPSSSVSSTVKVHSNLQNDAQKNRRPRLDCNLCGPAKGTILMCVVLERLAFYGLTGNLVLFLNKYPFLWESYHAMNATFLFFGITYIMSLLGGWIADSCLGRFKTLLLAFGFYSCGVVLMPFLAATSNTALDNSSYVILPGICLDTSNETNFSAETGPFDERCAWLIYLTLIVIAIGCGALKANICPFGFDQLAGAPHDVQFSFFNWYYWCGNIGSIIAFSVVAFVEQQESFQIGYTICTASLGLAFIIFVSGSYYYKFCPPHGSVLSNIFQIIQEASRVKNQRKKERRLNERIAECRDMQEVATAGDNISFLDHAKHQYGGIFHSSLVEDVKKLKLILAVFAVSIPYWLVYFQMQTTFLFQGLHMRLGSGKTYLHNTSSPLHPFTNSSDWDHHSSFVLVAAWFTLFDAATVILLLPLLDRFIYPYLEKRGCPFTFARRIILGMVFALASMVVAGVVEYFRLQAYWPFPDEPCVSREVIQEIGNTIYYAADMSVFWQIPQYVLIGFSEVFTSVACLQFAVSVAPKSMKALITGLYYMFMGIGSFSGTAIMSILSSSKIWFFDRNYGNINCRFPCKKNYDVEHSCHLDYYFYLLAGLELIAILLFLLISYFFDFNRIEQLISSRLVQRPPRCGSVQKDEIISAS